VQRLVVAAAADNADDNHGVDVLHARLTDHPTTSINHRCLPSFLASRSIETFEVQARRESTRYKRLPAVIGITRSLVPHACLEIKRAIVEREKMHAHRDPCLSDKRVTAAPEDPLSLSLSPPPLVPRSSLVIAPMRANAIAEFA
jgi:hypothetical protein